MFKFEKVKRFENIEVEAPARKTKQAAGYDMVAAEEVVIPPMNNLMAILSENIAGERLTQDIRNLVDKLSKTNIPAAQSVLDATLTCTTKEIADYTKMLGCKPTLISTGYKACMPDGYSLDLLIRSSSPLKYWVILANGVGLIDADYYNNPDNEGEIFFQVINLLPVPIKIAKGEIIGQAKFVPFETTVDDELQEKMDRASGFGSTTEKVEVEEEEGVEIVE